MAERDGMWEHGVTPAELAEHRPRERPSDLLGELLGSATYVRNHRFEGLALPRVGRGPALAVSRFYWCAEPPTAVDFARELRFGRPEAEAKAAWCEGHSIRYALLADEWDVERLAEVIMPEVVDPSRAPRPVAGPRRGARS